MINQIVAVFAGVCLVGCATSELSSLKKLQDQPEKIEVRPISSNCSSDAGRSPECAQIEEIHAQACLTLAQREGAPGAACPPATETARRRLKCAADGYAAAKTGNSFSTDQLSNITENRARALYCGATLVARAHGIGDAREASRELATLPENPRRDQLAAAAALYIGNSEDLSAAERCDGARRSVELANRGLANGPSGDVLTGLNNTKRLALVVIGHLPSCKAP